MNIRMNLFQKRKKKKESNQANEDDVAKLLQIFPDRSAAFCSKLLNYFDGKFDVAVNSVLEGTVPLSIDDIDDDDDDDNNDNNAHQQN